MSRVLVTGMGIISAIGNDISENYHSLKAGGSGISSANYFESAYTEILPFGEVKSSNSDLINMLDLADATGYTRTDLLAVKAFKEAVLDAGLSEIELTDWQTGIISGSTVGGMCLTDQLYDDANRKTSGSEYLNAYACSAHTQKLINLFKIRGFSDTLNTACSSSANAIMLGAKLIKQGRAKRVIVGGVDSLAKYTVNGFNALKILSSFPSRPFDQNRDGLNLGEAGAYLVLEAENEAAHKKIYGEICGFGNSNDAHLASALSDAGVGPISAMTEALSRAGIQPSQVDYINTHGTGTPNNDQVEMTALQSVFGIVPPFSSTKPYTGHTLGAAGAVEAIFSLISIGQQEMFPTLHWENPMEGFSQYPLVGIVTSYPLNYVLSNSFGFGGNCTSLLIGKV